MKREKNKKEDIVKLIKIFKAIIYFSKNIFEQVENDSQVDLLVNSGYLVSCTTSVILKDGKRYQLKHYCFTKKSQSFTKILSFFGWCF